MIDRRIDGFFYGLFMDRDILAKAKLWHRIHAAHMLTAMRCVSANVQPSFQPQKHEHTGWFLLSPTTNWKGSTLLLA